MAKPTVYKWTDPGAPQITSSDSASYQALFQAVLIDGYGSKQPPSTGVNKWSIPFSDANSFILKQGGTNPIKCCLKLNIASNFRARFNVALDYDDLISPVEMWSGFFKSNRLGMGYSENGNTVPWIIFATERTIICQFGNNKYQSTTDVFDNEGDKSFNYHWMFGDYEPIDSEAITSPYFIIGSNNSDDGSKFARAAFTSNDNSYSYKYCYSNAGEQKMIPLIQTPMGKSNDWIARQHYGLPDYPNTLNGKLYLQKAIFMVGTGIVGTIPGLVYSPQSRIPNVGTNLTEFQGTGEFTGSTLHVFNTYLGQYMIHDGEWGVE